jgi:anti-sigma regulatory factor (Ser/Thr protein kinase)
MCAMSNVPPALPPDLVVDVELAVPADLAGPHVARAFLNQHVDDLPADAYDNAVLLVSELVTNAVRHGRAQITLRLAANRDLVHVEVTDDGDTLPVPRDHAPARSEPGGRGLWIVDAIASSWGVALRSSATGKTVWFVLRRP